MLFRHIAFSEEDEFRLDDEGKLSLLTDLSHINILVGGNNSGKSRILRMLAAKKIWGIQEPSSDLSSKIQHLGPDGQYRQRWIRQWPQALRPNTEIKGILFEKMFLRSSAEWCSKQTNYSWDLSTEAFRQNLRSSDLAMLKTGLSEPVKRVLTDMESIVSQRAHGEDQTNKEINLSDLHCIYIPTLRTLRPIIQKDQLLDGLGETKGTQSRANLKNEQVSISLEKRIEAFFGGHQSGAWSNFADLFQTATLRDYPILRIANSTQNPQIFTGMSIYQDIQNLLLGTQEERKRVRDFESYLSLHFFEGEELELIPSVKTPGILQVKIAHGKDRPVHDLGDGIQAIIAILYPIFTQISANQPTFVCIEEPELNLHAGLQRQLLQALRNFPNAQFFLTTHSNHILETVFDEGNISLYRVRKDYLNPEEKWRDFTDIFPVVNGHRNILDDLGVINTSVFLSNCTIWVEGITARLLFRHYLKLYLEFQAKTLTLMEGKHYSFVEYGGSNITHWSFLDDEDSPIDIDQLCGRAFVIADDDNAKAGSKKEERHKTLEKNLGDRFIKLPCKETENLLSPEVISKIVTSYGATNSDQAAFELNSDWATYSDKALGKFIDLRVKQKEFKLKERKGKPKSFADGNTIRDKGEFCRRAIESTQSWKDLTLEAQTLTQKIHAFIVESNHA